MGEFIEGGAGDNPALPTPKIFTNEFITGVVKKSIENGDMPADHKLAFIGAVDEKGVRAILSVQVLDKPVEFMGQSQLNIKIQSIAEYEWTGEKKAGAQLLFSMR
jgi:hypothetical protein